MPVTVYRCPVASCGWTRPDKVTPGLPSWEGFFFYQHSFTSYDVRGELAERMYLDLERVLYSHLATHTPQEWFQTLRETHGKCTGCGGLARECEACCQ